MMDALNTRAAQIVALAIGLVILVVGIGFYLAFAAYLGWLLVIEITALALLLPAALAVVLIRHARAPLVVYDSDKKEARMIDGLLVPHKPYAGSVTSLTYHDSARISAPQAPALAAPGVEAAPTLPRAEAFVRIAREIFPGHLVLGYNVAGPIVGDISDLLSTAIIGRPGTGKTTALRFVCAQVLRIGGKPVLLDPHGSIADEVSDVLECAEGPDDMQTLALHLEQELDARLAARKTGIRPAAPLLLLADEWPVIAQLAPEAVRVAGRIVLEGRKVKMFALISGQGLPSDQLGGSYIRDALSSRYVFNTTTAQARMAGMDSETAKLLLAHLETAGPGYAILASARRHAEIVAIPQTTIGDLRALVGDVPPLPPLPPLPPNPNYKPSLSLHEEPQNAPKTVVDEERERIQAALAAHPEWTNARVFHELGYRNNNMLSKIKAIREEGNT